MEYLLDTVAVVRHFSGYGKIGQKAATILDHIETREDKLLISAVSLMEILYLAEKHRISVTLPQTLDLIESSSKYEVVNLNSAILRVAMEISFPELHDRLILATAKWLEIPIISSDQLFTGVPGISVVWD